METKVLISSLVLLGGISYFSIVRSRLIPKTIKRLRDGYYPYPRALEKYELRKNYREKDILFLERIITSDLSDSKYFMLAGRKGAGKTTLVEIIIGRLRQSCGIIYLKAEQTPNLKTFNQDLAFAINFNLNQKRLTDGSIITNLWSGANRQETEALDEFVIILNHLELAAKCFQHESDYLKPTLIIDHITYLADNNPQALNTLQAKAKYWADHNVITVIFVGTDGRAPLLLSQHSDSTRLEYVEISGMTYPEAVIFMEDEFNQEKNLDAKTEAENKKRIRLNIIDFYKKTLQTSKKADAPSDDEKVKRVFEYLVFNYTGGNFMDVMKCVEHIKEGSKLHELEEYFLRKAFLDLLAAGLLFEHPFDNNKVAILKSMKKMYLSPSKSLSFREFRAGVDEKKTLEYLSKNVFLYNRETGVVKFGSPSFVRYIEKEIDQLNEALTHGPDRDKPRLIYRI